MIAASRNFGDSIIRRSTYLAIGIAPSVVANVSLLLAASYVMSADTFGILYASIVVSNILFAPSAVLTLFYSRHITLLMSQSGEDAAAAGIRFLQRNVIWWGCGVSVITFLTLLLARGAMGVSSSMVILMIVAITYLSYIADIGRLSFQALEMHGLLAGYNFLWLGLRFALCIGGILALGNVWGGLSGIALAALLASLVFQLFLWQRYETVDTARIERWPPFFGIIPYVLAYTAFSLLCYADVIAAYFLLPKTQLSAYSASSIAPKGLLMVAMPVIQVFFPLMTRLGATSQLLGRHLLRGIAATALLTVAITAVLIPSTPYHCGTDYILRDCDTRILPPLLLSMILQCIIRVCIAYDLARARPWGPMIAVIPITVFAVGCATLSEPNVEAIANLFLAVSAGTILLYLAKFILSGQRTT